MLRDYLVVAVVLMLMALVLWYLLKVGKYHKRHLWEQHDRDEARCCTRQEEW